MKLVDVKLNTYIDSNKEIKKKDPYFKIAHIVRIAKSKSFRNAKIKNIEDKIPDFTNLAISASLNAKINEFKGEIPKITNFATTAALTTVENKIPNFSGLVRQVHYDAKISEMKNKYFTTFYHNKFSSDDKVAEITHKNLVNESNLNKKIKK